MNQLNQIGIGVVLNKDFLKSHPHRETSIAGAVAMPAKDAPHNVNDVLPKVAILLCNYHGQHYLAEQLDSFQAQLHSNWEIWASDDGSEDDTHAILEAYQQKWPTGRLSIYFEPAEGFAANFLSLTRKAGIEADCYAYSDQDDIWEADKLERAVRWVETVPSQIPPSTAHVLGWSMPRTTRSVCHRCFPSPRALPMRSCKTSVAEIPWCSTMLLAHCCAKPVKILQ